MKKQIISYIDGIQDMAILSMGKPNAILEALTNYIVDFKEENTDVAEDNTIYIKRNVELQDENEQLEGQYKVMLDTNGAHRMRITKLEKEIINIRNEDGVLKIQLAGLKGSLHKMNEKGRRLLTENKDLVNENTEFQNKNIALYNENTVLKDEVADLKEIRSVTLSAGKELQELRSKLAEVEKAAEYSCKLYHDASMKLAETNNKLNYDNEVLKCRNEKLEKELIFGAK